MPQDTFQSTQEFLNHIKNEVGSWRTVSREWAGNESMMESYKKLQDGDESLVPEASKLVDQLESSLEFPIPFPQYRYSVEGGSVDVPSAIMGLPESMRRKVLVESEVSPIKVYVCSTSSGGVSAREMNQRGCAVLALVMLLQLSRPVELWTFTCLGCHSRKKTNDAVIKIKLESNPIRLSESAYVLTSAGFARNLTYRYSDSFGASGGWASWFNIDMGNDKFIKNAREALGSSEQDVILPPAVSWDGLTKEPLKWINRTYNQIMNLKEENS